jgi:hypothetical protein
MRLKDVPEIFTVLLHLLKALRKYLDDLIRSQTGELVPGDETSDSNANLVSESDSETSSLSFESVSSFKISEKEGGVNFNAVIGQSIILDLRWHVETTMDQLFGHAHRIERAGAEHRRQRLGKYKLKNGPSQVFELFLDIGTAKADHYPALKNASSIIRARIAESFARRRIRFEYLKKTPIEERVCS